MNFNDIVTAALEREDKNKTWLADQLGISRGTLSRYFKNPTLDTIRRIDAVLPLPEAAGLLHGPDVLRDLSVLSAEFVDVLEDPQARADFDALVSTIAQLSPQQMHGLRLLLSNDDTPAK